MNPFDALQSYKDVILKSRSMNPTATISMEEHIQRMVNLIDMITSSLENAEYEIGMQYPEKLTLIGNFKFYIEEVDNIVFLKLYEAMSAQEQHEIMETLQNAVTKGALQGKYVMLIPDGVSVMKAKLLK